MKKTRVVLSLAGKPVDSKIESNKNVIQSMTGNAHFPNPTPSLAAVTAANNKLEASNTAAKDKGKSKIAQRRADEAAVDNLMMQLGNYVEAVANAAAANGGDAEAIITSAGMDYRHARTTHSLPPDAPLNVTAVTTANEGEIELHFSKVKGAYVYVIEMTTDASVVGSRTLGAVPNTTVVWTQVRILKQTKYLVSTLVSGTKYAFRVFAVGAKGYGAYSNVVVGKAL